MKPPMKQLVTLFIPTGQKDEYSRPITTKKESKSRVQYSTRVIKGTNGQEYQTSLEVDLPADVYVSFGVELEYKDPFEKVTKGQVLAMNESTNLTGNIVYYRTVYVG
ncbi:hypothetical protein [Sutcliffiella horikoshii]|uniref:hypothetical protein n=1 Tax=Sutcliffiella horikoshii TaxID=79883 RepID=UPI003CEEFFD4